MGLPLCIHHGCHMGNMVRENAMWFPTGQDWSFSSVCPPYFKTASTNKFTLGIPERTRYHHVLSVMQEDELHPRFFASKSTELELGWESQKSSQQVRTHQTKHDQASAVKCSTPKPRRQKKTGTTPFVLGPLVRNARMILQSTSSARCCPPY